MIYSNDVKVYQIHTGFYELVDIYENESKVRHIIAYHKSKREVIDLGPKQISKMSIDQVDYILYVFNQVEQESTWKKFLPDQISAGYDFNVQSTSFVLFVLIGKEIFALIGGRGISVIKRFINHSFGIDLYEKIAEPENDIIFSLNSRGVSGNLTAEQQTYRNEQKLIDSLTIGRVPNKINLILRQDLKDSIFDFIDFKQNENIYLEIGSSFCLKWKLTFDQTHQLILKMHEILEKGTGKPLSRFERVTDQKFCDDNLKFGLYDHLRDDMVRLSSNTGSKKSTLDYDFVHPRKLPLFYECDSYRIYLKGARNHFYETRDRETIYYQTLKHLNSLVDPTNPWSFRKYIAGVRVRGFINDQIKTEAPFINHLTCEIRVNNTPYFLIDDTWYKVRGNFIGLINEQCATMLKSNEILNNPLNYLWPIGQMDEGEYNLQYLNENGFIVLDKMLGQNIELCDLLYETNDTIYLIHVKEGFDAKIRDLTNQVLISASRLWNDLKSDMMFVREVYHRYSQSSNFTHPVTLEEFERKFTSKEIVFAVAFCHNKSFKVHESITDFKSNIAKFSLIQSIREMQSYYYPLKVIEIKRE